MYTNLNVSADTNGKRLTFDLRNKVSQRITRNDSDVHIDYRRKPWDKSCPSIRRKAVEFFDPDE